MPLFFYDTLGHIHWEARDTARRFFERNKVINLYMLPDRKIAHLREMLLDLGIDALDERVLDPLIEEHLQVWAGQRAALRQEQQMAAMLTHSSSATDSEDDEGPPLIDKEEQECVAPAVPVPAVPVPASASAAPTGSMDDAVSCVPPVAMPSEGRAASDGVMTSHLDTALTHTPSVSEECEVPNMDDARATPGITFTCGTTVFQIPASALEVAVDQMEGAEEMLEVYRRQGAPTDHENMGRIAYLSEAAQREVTRSVPDLEKAIFLMSLAAPTGPVADPSANDVAVLDKRLRKYVEEQTPGRRLRKMDNKKMRKLLKFMASCGVVALDETVAAD